jgi:hypothetical protein
MSNNGKPTFKERLARFYAGRYGNDEFSRALLVAALVLLVASLATGTVLNGVLSNILWVISLLLLAYGYFRTFSKNIYARQAENEKYVFIKRKLFGDRASRARRREESKRYKRFSCPRCKAKMRVPRNKGKVKVTCAKCGSVFFGKT